MKNKHNLNRINKHSSHSFKNWFEWHPISIGLIVFLTFFLILILLRFLVFSDIEKYSESVFIEATGILFDILIFAVIIDWLTSQTEQRRLIQRLYDEIEDYLGVEEKEATARIVARIRRLNDLGYAPKKLNQAYLKEANLRGLTLTNVDMEKVNISGADLTGAILHKANLTDSDLSNAILREADLSKSQLDGANMLGVSLDQTNLKDASLCEAIIIGASGYSINQLCEAKNLNFIYPKELAVEINRSFPGRVDLHYPDPSLKEKRKFKRKQESIFVDSVQE